MSSPAPHPASSLLQQLADPLFSRHGLEVSMLRTDLIHPVISGNKWMKLQPWLQQAEARQLRGFVTKGGPYSNHIHAAAYAAKLNRLSCTIIVKASQGMMTPTIADAIAWNAKIIYAPAGYDDDDKWLAMAAREGQLFIPMGGDGAIAAAGVRDYITGLGLIPVDHMICPVGTATTFKGIAATGLFKKSVTGINPGIRDDFDAIAAALKTSLPQRSVTIESWPELEKFGSWPPFLPELMNYWHQHWQVPTDIVYTAKMCYAFIGMIKAGRFAPGESVLLVHTGGLQGNRSLPPGLLHF